MLRLPPRLALIASALALAGCSRAAADRSVGAGELPAPAVAAAAGQPSGGQPSGEPVEAPAPARGEPTAAPPVASSQADSTRKQAADDEDWPEAAPGEKLRLTWVVYPDPAPDAVRAQGPLWPTELVVRVGAKMRRVPVGTATGSLFPNEQHVCQPPSDEPNRVRASGELARISFYLGGSESFVARRSRGWIEIWRVLATDGACVDHQGQLTACPTQDKLITRVKAPGPMPVAERIVMVEGKGKEHDLECGM